MMGVLSLYLPFIPAVLLVQWLSQRANLESRGIRVQIPRTYGESQTVCMPLQPQH